VGADEEPDRAHGEGAGEQDGEHGRDLGNGERHRTEQDRDAHAVSLEGKEDVVERAAYALANPVAAGLVSRGSEWTLAAVSLAAGAALARGA
jgi:hypothetical protein